MFSKTDFLNRMKNANPLTKCAVVFFLAALVLIMSGINSGSDATPALGDTADSLSTYIPAGQRMVPLEILNSDALDSILGRFGYVDLYLPGRKNVFARGVRIVKSIDGSGAWAALVTEHLADELMAVGARFHVAVQPLRGRPAQSQIIKTRPARAIVYEGN